MLPPAVLFDLDGTLVDSNMKLVEAFQRTYRSLYDDSPVEADDFHSYGGIGLQPFASRMFGITEPSELDRFEKAFWEQAEQIQLEIGTVAIPGAVELVTWLSEQRVPLGLVTTNSSRIARIHLDNLGLRDVFDVIIGSDVVKDTKPHPAPVRTALVQLGISPEQYSHVIMLGDSASDVGAALNADIRPVLFDQDNNGADKLQAAIDFNPQLFGHISACLRDITIVTSHFNFLSLFRDELVLSTAVNM